MKLYLLILCNIILTKSVHGGLVRDIFGKAHDVAHDVRQDVRNIFHPTETSDPQDVSKPEDVKSDAINKQITESVSTRKIESSTQVATTAPTKSNVNVKEQSGIEKNLEVKSSTTIAPVTNGTSTEKDGRENFAGGCLANYKRTADGRCMPVIDFS